MHYSTTNYHIVICRVRAHIHKIRCKFTIFFDVNASLRVVDVSTCSKARYIGGGKTSQQPLARRSQMNTKGT